jgi:hypothetical protein
LSPNGKSPNVEQVDGSGYQPSGSPSAGSSLKREATSVKTVEEMRLSELLKLSGALARVRTLDIGNIVMSVGVGLVGAAVGAAATGEALFSGVPLFSLVAGVVGVVLGFALSRERGEEIGAVRRNLDFDIDGWCQDDKGAADMRDRYEQAMKSPSLFGRALQTLRRKQIKE